MDFILLLGIAAIPLMVSISLLVYSRNKLSEALSFFIFMICLWQVDISVLYAHQYFSGDIIDRWFRLFRIGPIMTMPILYYFSFFLVNTHSELDALKKLFNKTGLYIVSIFSVTVYLVNFTSLGIKDYRFIPEGLLSPPHLLPVYGILNPTFYINICLVFLTTLFLLIISFKTKDRYYSSFYKKLAAGALLLLFNGLISGFNVIPLFFSSFNSILAAIIIFLAFYQMQSKRLSEVNLKLSKQSSLLEAIMDTNPHYLIVTDSKDRIISINDTFLSLFPSARTELIGLDISVLMEVPYHLPLINNQLQKVTTMHRDHRFIHWGQKHLRHDKLEMYTLYYGIDLTSQKKHEEFMISAEKFKVIGELSASIAHEVRNPLTTVRGFIQLLKEETEGKEYEELLIDEIDSINKVMNEILLLAKPEAHSSRPGLEVQRMNVMDELLKINVLFEGISLEQNKDIQLIDFQDGKSSIHLTAFHFKHIIVNILKNSMEALPPKGTVRIKVDEISGKTRIRIIDNGKGIFKDRLSKIGEPYYSNDEKGSGIGMTICHKLVRDYGGELIIKSKVEWGTVVTIILDSAEEPSKTVNITPAKKEAVMI
ncbi:hypothetical protein D3H55_04905 [Bacillus salacetis]|uniref:histidine kinase n=1 Tax=Bacillus salacetis TaxID=2315464 RepID=A0A3A1R3R5_9BACI|nr:ATP-binding protein [Bacillus salacetis]RIW37375.1 hypothetical protein D3H55_04905 [Bacillus salacetis]